MKKVSLVLVLLMLTAMMPGFAGAAELNTTDPITLTYSVWDSYEMYEFLAQKFEELHPNIDVQILQLGGTDVYMSNLTNLAAEGKFPDVFQHLNLDSCIINGWFADITEYVEADEEYQNGYYKSLQDIGYLDGERCFFIANKYLPITVYLDEAVFEKENVPMPEPDWSWEQMIELMETMTRPDLEIWAYNSFLGILSIGPVALTDGALAEFGWDGEAYHFEEGWAESIAQEADFRRMNYRADSDPNYAALMGDVWAGQSGHVAIQHDAWWTMNNIYTQSDALERGLRMVPYAPPASETVEDSNALAFVDFGAVSSSCKNPREAFELLKFMSYGKDGWFAEIEGFATLVNEAGEKIYRLPDCVPLTEDEEVWAAFRTLFDDSPYWDGYFAGLHRPVSLGGVAIPGFNTFLSEVYNGSDYNGVIGIEAAVFEGVADPYDYADTLNAKGREYYDAVMDEFYAVYGK
ncbi:MAG: extracellular solute-binding protein [Oscillospiraceae bacterium]|jgi:multiple sugar transport system substrate-binding protein|nr:extracellular solute-binding protein [Oscillospiraceae bacterium]